LANATETTTGAQHQTTMGTSHSVKPYVKRRIFVPAFANNLELLNM
jgi:hypothetical protein